MSEAGQSGELNPHLLAQSQRYPSDLTRATDKEGGRVQGRRGRGRASEPHAGRSGSRSRHLVHRRSLIYSWGRRVRQTVGSGWVCPFWCWPPEATESQTESGTCPRPPASRWSTHLSAIPPLPPTCSPGHLGSWEQRLLSPTRELRPKRRAVTQQGQSAISPCPLVSSPQAPGP